MPTEPVPSQPSDRSLSVFQQSPEKIGHIRNARAMQVMASMISRQGAAYVVNSSAHAAIGSLGMTSACAFSLVEDAVNFAVAT